MKFTTHNEEHININGTYRQGYIATSFATLVKLFGNPLTNYQPGAKTNWEWLLSFDDNTVATIYNWKDGPGYGKFFFDAHLEHQWHVGGLTFEAYRRVEALVSQGVLTVWEAILYCDENEGKNLFIDRELDGYYHVYDMEGDE